MKNEFVEHGELIFKGIKPNNTTPTDYNEFYKSNYGSNEIVIGSYADMNGFGLVCIGVLRYQKSNCFKYLILEILSSSKQSFSNIFKTLEGFSKTYKNNKIVGGYTNNKYCENILLQLGLQPILIEQANMQDYTSLLASLLNDQLLFSTEKCKEIVKENFKKFDPESPIPNHTIYSILYGLNGYISQFYDVSIQPYINTY
ncbi:MAG: hypothetical protein F6K23_37680 [Okeania sp. SIO2C9]|uniref:hypothetical protein n=1 Tax=Okeania sp. SIO2C9 TaxID=2607791 RepID=UPI0013C043B2|nr:hypothetical protein [Okeania sp. SIO2C9]NEQ78223.1 hypothetical protein [Okeania sp. SIO2C9]